MFYRSFIIASLSVQVKEYPFNDMESLSKTKWRYACWNHKIGLLDESIENHFSVIVEGKTSGTTQTLSKAPIGTAYEKVYRNNMNDNSYSKSVYDGIQRILKEPSSTLWAQDTYVFSSQEYMDCKVSLRSFQHMNNQW